MIKVEKTKNEIKIVGHSNYDLCGKDIVCSSVSSIFITTINAILDFDKDAIEYQSYVDKKDDNNDYSLVIIKKNDDITNKLINNMMNLFKDLSRQYPKNINVKES